MNELVNQRTLADALNLTTRRVQQLEDRGVIIPQPDGDYDLERNRDRYWLFRDHQMDRVLSELEQAAERADQLISRIRKEPDIRNRRRLAKEHGADIGRLHDAMRLANAMSPEHARQLLGDFTTMVFGRAVSELFELCRWQLER